MSGTGTDGGKRASGSRLYDRRFSIVVADPQGNALDLSALRSTFVVRQWDAQTPNNCDLHVTNVSRQTASRLSKEFTRVQISAGYDGLYGIIFDGFVVQARYGRDTPTDTYLHIVAADGDPAHNFAYTATTLAAGSTPADAHRAVLKAFNPYGVLEGYTDPAVSGPALPRGKVLFGMARDTMRDVANRTGTTWSIHNGRMDVISRTGYLPNEAVVITAETGMVGLPAVTPDGVVVRTLLNPLLRPGQRVKLDNASIQRPRQGPDIGSAATFPATYPPGLIDADGSYRILAVDHSGDTRGNGWYSDISCVGLALTGTPASVLRRRSVGGAAAVPAPQAAPLNAPATPTAPGAAGTPAPAVPAPAPTPLYVDPTTHSRGY